MIDASHSQREFYQPWYLTTTAVAEQLYDALIVWNQLGSLNVTSTSLAFFQQFSSSVTAGTYASSTTTFQTLTAAVKTFADGFLAVNAKYTPSGGGLAEQYSRSTGAPVSAVDLTWSYAAALTVFNARAGNTTASWGAAGLTLPSTCSGNSGSGGSSGTVAVTFNVQATTFFGGAYLFFGSLRARGSLTLTGRPAENIYITGSVDALQNWSPDTALILSAANYPTWSSTSSRTLCSSPLRGTLTSSPPPSHREPPGEHRDPVQVHPQVPIERHLGVGPEHADHDPRQRLVHRERHLAINGESPLSLPPQSPLSLSPLPPTSLQPASRVPPTAQPTLPRSFPGIRKLQLANDRYV